MEMLLVIVLGFVLYKLTRKFLLGKDGASLEEPREWKEWRQWRERSRQYATPQQGAARIQGSKSGADDSHTDYSELGAGLAAAAGMAGGAYAASGHLWQEDVDAAMTAGGAPALADDCLSRQTNPVYAHEPDNIYHGTSIDPTANFSDTIGMGSDFGSGNGFDSSDGFGSRFDNSDSFGSSFDSFSSFDSSSSFGSDF